MVPAELVQDLDLVKDRDLVQDPKVRPWRDQDTRSRPGIQDQELICLMKIFKFDLKGVHMARYELILRLDEAICFTIIFQPLLAPKRPMDGPKIPKEFP